MSDKDRRLPDVFLSEFDLRVILTAKNVPYVVGVNAEVAWISEEPFKRLDVASTRTKSARWCAEQIPPSVVVVPRADIERPLLADIGPTPETCNYTAALSGLTPLTPDEC